MLHYHNLCTPMSTDCLQIKQQHQDLAFRLIKVQRHVDALLGHVAIELGQKDPREGAVVEQLGAMLGQAESILGPGEAGARCYVAAASWTSRGPYCCM